MNLDKVKARINKINDCNKIDTYLTEILAEANDHEYDVLYDYAEERKAEIKTQLNPSGLDYPLYPHKKEFKVATQSWKEINPKNLSYWHWLEEVALPMFWKQPRPELQHKMLAIICAMNTNAVPPKNQSAKKEMPVPLIYLYGKSGSGKTQAGEIISYSYPVERTGIIMANSSGTSLRNMCHRLCYRGFQDDLPGFNSLYPAFLLIDNYEPRYLVKWGEFKMTLLGNNRSQAYAQIGNENQDNDYFFTHLIKVFTSVISPKAMTLAQEEFKRRFIYLFTEKSEEIKSISKYDFSDIPASYASHWSLSRVQKKWYPILTELLGKDDDETTIPPSRWNQSLCVIATGVFFDLFKDLNHGFEFMTEYWNWVSKEEEGMNNEISILMDDMISEALSNWEETEGSDVGISPYMPLSRFPKLLVSDIQKRVNAGILSKKSAMDDVREYLLNIKGWSYGVDRSATSSEVFYYLPWEGLIKIFPALEE